MVLKKRERLVSVPVRVSPQIRSQAKDLAIRHGVSESAVYRSVIDDFFSPDRQLKVDEMTTESEDEEKCTI